jgi:hypothetical protein
MKKRLLLVCPLLLLSPAVWGASVCTNTTLNVYTNNDAGGFSCTIGGLTFSNFQYTSPSGLPTETTVEVTPTNDGTNIGFFFTGAFTAGAGMSADAVLSYMISSGASAGIGGASVALISYGASGAGASASLVEGICTTAPQSNGACIPASNAYSLSVFDNADHPPAKQADSVTFAAATSTVFVSKNIVEQGGAGSATISQFENTVQAPGFGGPGGGPVPEPASMFTMGSGLIATCMLLRRKLKKG